MKKEIVKTIPYKDGVMEITIHYSKFWERWIISANGLFKGTKKFRHEAIDFILKEIN